MQQTVLGVGNEAAMVKAWQEVELVWDQHLLQQRALKVGKGLAMVKA